MSFDREAFAQSVAEWETDSPVLRAVRGDLHDTDFSAELSSDDSVFWRLSLYLADEAETPREAEGDLVTALMQTAVAALRAYGVSEYTRYWRAVLDDVARRQAAEKYGPAAVALHAAAHAPPLAPAGPFALPVGQQAALEIAGGTIAPIGTVDALADAVKEQTPGGAG